MNKYPVVYRSWLDCYYTSIMWDKKSRCALYRGDTDL